MKQCDNKPLTNVCSFGPIWRDLISHILIAEEVEALKGVEEEVSKVLIHVHSQDPAVKAVDGSPTIHHLLHITHSY